MELDQAHQKARALNLRAEGRTYRDVADLLDISVSTAHKYVSESLAAIPAHEAAELRSVEGQRLDALQAALWPTAISGDLGAVREVVRIIDRRARLFGLDSPAHVELGVGSVDIAGTAQRILEQLTGDNALVD